MTLLRFLILFALAAATAASAAPRGGKVLIFSHTTGYRHAAIETGVETMKRLVRAQGMEPVPSEAPEAFDDLSPYAALILLSSTTDPKKPESEWLVGARRESLQRFVRRGGGVVAIHAAADSHYHWPWYTRMIGGRFASHPAGTPKGTLHRVTRAHPATKALPERFERADEWYYFDDQDVEAQLLVTLDPASIGAADVNPNPVAWAKTFEGGRIFYTAMGHTEESYLEPLFLAHVAGGLRWTTSK
ncbi:MAG TPA: ThuA domain-containing protein [Allosphingosinicella sp.]|jgi:type 1 glutamine amidotransferase